MLDTGLEATIELLIEEADTALAMGSGDVPVLATPRMIALCEQATMSALVGHVEEGYTTVGLSVQVDHLRPTAVGHRIWAEAHLDKIEGRRLCFSVSAKDDRGLIGAGRVTRVVVEVEHFMEKTR
ncbi:MAG: hotdog domain-containing protein [Acidimicrobiales bacterium]